MDSGKIPVPVHIRIKPTNICNHHCRYCAYSPDTLRAFGKDSGKNKSFIPRQKMMEILDDIISMGVKAVTFSGGGEPFTYPYLLEAVRKLSASPVKFAALTNGSRLSGEVAEVFARRATWVRVSMDGWNEESYSSYRKVPPGEFGKVLLNMEHFKNLGGACYLGVSLIIDRYNAEHIYGLTKRLKGIGVDSVKMSPCLVSDKAGENRRYHKVIFGRVRRQIDRTIRELAGNDFEVFDAYKELNEKFQKDYTWCPCGQLVPVIGADRCVYMCPDKAYNMKTGIIGSIRRQRFRIFWLSSKRRMFRVNPSIDCNHHCERNRMNVMLMEYFSADPDHLSFV
jgi:MoaA/NifB/PqqE/SkfB family radical SAM enzyme